MACPVCFGGDDTLMRESLNTGIAVLMGVTSSCCRSSRDSSSSW
jgi:hypothetical protein